MRTMYDAIASKSANIPADAEMVAGYVVGPYSWTAADWARFPNAVPVTITTTAGVAANVLDVETGAANPDSAPPWCSIQRKHGGTPSVYCNLSTWPAAKAAFAAAGVTEPNWWIAAYDNVAEIPDGAVAKQYTDNAPSNPYDTSVVADNWPGVDNQGDTGMTQAELDALVAQIPGETSFLGYLTNVNSNIEGLVNSVAALTTAVAALGGTGTAPDNSAALTAIGDAQDILTSATAALTPSADPTA